MKFILQTQNTLQLQETTTVTSHEVVSQNISCVIYTWGGMSDTRWAVGADGGGMLSPAVAVAYDGGGAGNFFTAVS